jgi:hypothetical protein
MSCTTEESRALVDLYVERDQSAMSDDEKRTFMGYVHGVTDVEIQVGKCLSKWAQHEVYQMDPNYIRGYQLGAHMARAILFAMRKEGRRGYGSSFNAYGALPAFRV